MATFNGNNSGNTINGTNGDDTINGNGGNDHLDGKAGNDTINGGTGDDTIFGGTGNDTIHGNANNDEIHGGDHNDTIFGDDGNDELYGDSGVDTISGGTGDDEIYGGTGDDTLHGDANNDEIHGGDNNDTITGDDGNDELYGDSGVDNISGGNGDDEIEGGTGNDILHGNGNDDTVNGGDGDDTITGDDGNDVLDGGNNNDNVNGGSGNDIISGGDGNDTLTGGGGLDLIYGGNGTDTAVYSGAIAEYDFYQLGPLFGVVHNGGAGADGADLLLSVEKLQFADVTIDLTQNNAPIALNDTAATNEDAGTYSSGAASVLDNDFDFENDPLTATPGSFVGTYGTLNLNSNGTYTYVLNANAQTLAQGQVGQDVFTYTVSDGSATDTGTLTINVAGLNDAPVANPDAASTSENAVVFVSVLGNDTDVDNGAVLTVTSASAPVGQGTATVVGNQVRFDPGADFDNLAVGQNEVVVVNYSIQDQFGASSSSTVTITVTGTNDGPVANPDTASGTENQVLLIDVLVNDTDVDDGHVLTVTAASAPPGQGTASVVSNKVQFNPGTDFDHLAVGATQIVTVNYSIQDEHGATSSSTVTITVTGTNDGPVANPDTAAGTENQILLIDVLVNDTDADDGHVLTVTAASAPPGQGTATVVANQVQFNPGTDFDHLAVGATQVVTVNYSIQDEHGASSSSTIAITVTGTNDGPVANPDAASGAENQTLLIDVLVNDTDVDDGHMLTVTAATAPPGQGTASVVSNQVQFDPGTDFDHLAVGESQVVVVNYSIQDEHGAPSSSNVTITVTGTNDAPTIDAGGTDDSGSVTELPNNDPGENVFVHQDSGTIAFDDVDTSDVHSATASPQGGGYLGTFTLDPVNQAGDTVEWHFSVSDADLDSLDAGDTLTQIYTVQIDDGHGGTTTQDVTITINGAADNVPPDGTNWYIDNSAVGSANDGSIDDPFTSIAAFNAAQGTPGGPGINDNVFLLAGTGIYAEADGINLLDGQTLTGVGQPTIAPLAGDGVDLAQNNTLSGFDVATSTGVGIADGGGTVGSLNVSDVAISGSSQILDIDQGGTLNVTLNGASSTASSGGAIDLAGVGGSFTISGATTIVGVHSGGGIDITGSSITATFSGGGNVSTAGATAVNFVGNSGALALGGGFDIVTTSGTGLNATGGGTVTVTGSGNSISADSGIALNVANTTIGAADLTFQSISAGTGVGTAGVGISLDTTGSLGGLHVTGTGVAGSGGTIQNKAGADGSTTGGIGIYMNNTADVQLDRMALHDFGNFAVRGVNVNGFTLNNSVVNGVNGSNGAPPFNEGSLSFSNLLGSASIANSSISGGFADNVRVVNTSGTLNRLTMSGDTIGDNGASGNDGVTIEAQGTANVNVTVDGTAFTGARGDLFQFNAPGSGTSDLVFTDNTLSNNHVGIVTGGGGVTIGSGGTSVFTFDVSDNSFRDAVGHGVLIVKDIGTGTMTGVFDGNTIGVIGVANSGSLEGAGLRLLDAGGGTVDVDITNNQIREYNNEGIVLQAGAGIPSGGTFIIEVAGNTVSNPGTNPVIGSAFQGFLLNNGVAPGDSFMTYLTLGGDGAQENNFTGSGRNGGVDMRIRARQNTDVHVTANDATGHVPAAPNATYHYTGGLTDGAALATFVGQHNLGSQAHATANTGEFRGDSPPLPASLMVSELPSPASLGDDNVLDQAELDLLVDAAIRRWSDAGATAEQLASMRAVSVVVSDIAGANVGSSEAGRILLDTDGAGYGWFVDLTPDEDSEFDSAGAHLLADAGGLAEGRVDALTVVMHELGHQIGLGDDYGAASEADLMHGYIDAGERRLPDGVFETEAAAMPAGRAEWGEMLPSHPDLPLM